MPTILYVDDEPINLELFKINFERDYKVYIAQSPSEGLYLLAVNDIDFVITDFKMPEMNGVELAREIRQHYPGKGCMVLTGFVVSEEIEEALNDNTIQHCMLKPWKRDELVAVLKKVTAEV